MWKPLEIREARPEKARKVQKLGLLLPNTPQSELKLLTALESGRYDGSCDNYKLFIICPLV